MWDNWKCRENHGYGCPMLRVGAQNGLMATNRCPMEEIIGHRLGIGWAIGGPAPPPRRASPRWSAPVPVAQLGKPGKGEFSPGDMGLYSRGKMEKLPKNEAKKGLWSGEVGREKGGIPGNGPHGLVARGGAVRLLPYQRIGRIAPRGRGMGCRRFGGMANPPAGARRHGIRMTMACIYVGRWPETTSRRGIPAPVCPAQKARIAPGLHLPKSNVRVLAIVAGRQMCDGVLPPKTLGGHRRSIYGKRLGRGYAMSLLTMRREMCHRVVQT